jgi:predicted ATPase/transcriptional regulator with XRE-family HTH domain
MGLPSELKWEHGQFNMEHSFGDWLRQRRRSLDLTQEELARQVGCSAITLRKLEAEARRPSKQIADRLADVLKVAPGERPVFLRFARGDPFAAPALSQTPNPLHPPQRLPLDVASPTLPEAGAPDILQALRSARLAPKHNLPAQLTSFIGRKKEIEQIKQRLAPLSSSAGDHGPRSDAERRNDGPGVRARLVTLTGSGGTGKTRLALQVARELVPAFPDGVWFVDFAPLTDPALVPQAVRVALGLREVQERSLPAVLADYVRDRTLLLLFDNCEHLIDACARLAETLVRAGPNVSILATSREALGVAGEAAVRIPSLSLPEAQPTQPEVVLQSEAGRLFVERAQTAWPDFAATDDNAPVIARVCRSLDGIPLAIELAAVWVKTLQVEQIAARLDDRFHLLTGGSRTALPRQQTLRALIDWSYNLLTEPERALLRRLSVFAGGWTLEAAEALGGEEAEVLELLMQLVNKSLVVAERQPGAEARYALLETIRQYAREKLLETDEGAALSRRHLKFFMRLAEALEGEIRGANELAALNRLETEHDNIRAALEWAISHSVGDGAAIDADTALRLSGAIWLFWHYRQYWGEGHNWLSKILALPGAQARSLARAKALNGLTYLTRYWRLPASSPIGLSYAARYRRHPDSSLPVYEESVSLLHEAEESMSLWRELENPRQEGYLHALRTLGETAYHAGDQTRGRALIEESLGLAQVAGDNASIAWSLFNLGLFAREEGRPEAAWTLYAESLAHHRQAHFPTGIAYQLNAMAWQAIAQQDWAAAQPLIEESLRLCHDLGDRAGLGGALNTAGAREWLRGQYDRAGLYFTESLEVAQAINLQGQAVEAVCGLAWMSLHLGDHLSARQHLLQHLRLGRENSWPGSVISSLAGFSALAEALGQPARAIQLLGAAETQRMRLNLDWDTLLRAETGRLQAALRNQLDETAFAEAWAAGEKMTLEEAVGYALQSGS